MSKGRLYVVSGPSGAGKGTVLNRLLETTDGLWKSVSATTRKPREGEVDGKDYFFVDREDFERIASEKGFLEWAEYSGNLYGTPVESVRQHLDAGENVILEIEVQGALQIREVMPDAVLVFIEPPSMEELERRLRERGSEDEAAVERRLETAKLELSKKMEYDNRFVNDDIDETVTYIASFILSTSSKVKD